MAITELIAFIAYLLFLVKISQEPFHTEKLCYMAMARIELFLDSL